MYSTLSQCFRLSSDHLQHFTMSFMSQFLHQEISFSQRKRATLTRNGTMVLTAMDLANWNFGVDHTLLSSLLKNVWDLVGPLEEEILYCCTIFQTWLQSAMGHVDRFEIIFDNEQGVFHEGDRVSGHVEIVNSENVKYKGELCRQIVWSTCIFHIK